MHVRHHPITISLHWLTFLVVISAVSAVLGREATEEPELRSLLLNIHRSCGILVLGLAAIRLISRIKIETAHVSAHLPPLNRIIAALAHGAIYLLMLALPISGWLQTSAMGKPVTLFGFLPLPPLIAHDREFAEQLEGIHELLAWTMMALIALHVAAALWHHFVHKDHVLKAMLPPRKS